MTYEEALEAIHHNMWKNSIPGLKRITELMALLGNPQDTLKYVHIAGSNGKGSVAVMTASILQKAGYVTGLCTSPYISRFNERMRVNGVPISNEELVSVTEKVLSCAEKMVERPTEFELVSAITFQYFADKKCDVVVLEVGLGGRLDATNVILSPLVAVITAIGLEHTEFLGDTVEKIAVEKAGIIKEGTTAVVSDQKDGIVRAIFDVSGQKNVPAVVAKLEKVTRLSQDKSGQRLLYEGAEYFLPLLGDHQLQNVSTVFEIVKALRTKGFSLPESAVRDGLSATRWAGRFELLQDTPAFFVDGGHNPQCAQSVADTLSALFPNRKILFLLGILADKDYDGIINPVLPLAKGFVTITPPSPRAMLADSLTTLLACEYGIASTPCKTIEEGVQKILSMANQEDVICAYGSLYSVGEIRLCFGLDV